MAIKDQCLQCRFFNEAIGVCGRTGNVPLLNNSSCEMYLKKGISLKKTSEVSSSTSDNLVLTTPTTPPSNDPKQPCSKGMFQHVFSFEGRIRRLEFGLTFLIYLLYSLPMNVLSEGDISAGFALIWLMLLIPVMWALFAQGTKRCHDIGVKGWWQLVPFFYLWMIFQDGDSGTNQYGDNPKGE